MVCLVRGKLTSGSITVELVDSVTMLSPQEVEYYVIF